MRTTLALGALRMAFINEHPAPTSRSFTTQTPTADSQYTSIDYTQTLEDAGVLGSIGSVGDVYDNAAAESFVDSLKTEMIADRACATRSQLKLLLSSTSRGSTTSVCTKRSTIARHEIKDLYAATIGPIMPTRDQSWGPSKPVSVNSGWLTLRLEDRPDRAGANIVNTRSNLGVEAHATAAPRGSPRDQGAI